MIDYDPGDRVLVISLLYRDPFPGEIVEIDYTDDRTPYRVQLDSGGVAYVGRSALQPEVGTDPAPPDPDATDAIKEWASP